MLTLEADRLPSIITLGMREAKKQAHSSLAPIKLGAALIKSGRVLSSGRNFSFKSSPNSKTRYFGIHAEYHCLRRYLGDNKRTELSDITGAYLVVVRVKEDKLMLAKPCEFCQDMIKRISRLKTFYSNNDGSFSKL